MFGILPVKINFIAGIFFPDAYCKRKVTDTLFLGME